MHELRILWPTLGPVASDPASGYVHIGCSGWYYWHWKGAMYPSDVPSSQWFSIYQGRFKTVELNAPFYSWPTVGAVKTWIRQADPGFIYSIKVCELIKRFDETETLIRDFGYIADMLGPQMGCFLFQLPPSVRYSAETLHSILARSCHVIER